MAPRDWGRLVGDDAVDHILDGGEVVFDGISGRVFRGTGPQDLLDRSQIIKRGILISPTSTTSRVAFNGNNVGLLVLSVRGSAKSCRIGRGFAVLVWVNQMQRSAPPLKCWQSKRQEYRNSVETHNC